MSSRVQKGGAIFRPVTKARPRPAGPVSRQPSVALDAVPEDAATSSMPPPPVPHLELRQEQITIVSASQPLPVTHHILEAPISQPLPSPSPGLSGPSATNAASVTYSSINVEHRAPSLPPTLALSTPRPSHPIAIPIPTSFRASVVPSQQTSADRQDNFVSVVTASLSHTSAVIILSDNVNPTPTLLPPLEVSPPPENGNEDNGEKKVKRKRKRSTTGTPEGENGSSSSKLKGGRGRRSRGPSLPPYDPEADPGEAIDPTVVTMATLCDDTGQGRVSSKAAEILSNHAAWKQRNREKRNRMRALMEAKKYGRTEEESLLDEGSAPGTSLPAPPSSGPADDSNPDFDYTRDLTTSRFNVQVRIGPNGETVIDEDSLVVNREETEETANYTHITESDHTKFVNSGTYGKRFRGSRWSAEETELFYDALSQYGENYELIAYVLPGRDRKSCKNKFKVEDKRNHARINYTLNNQVAVDINTLSRMTGKDFSGPVPEIRAPTPCSIAPDTTASAPESSSIAAEERPGPTKKRRRTKASTSDEGVLIIGDADNVSIETDS